MSKYAFGVDVGGTTVKIGLFSEEGVVLDKWEIPTDKSNCGENVIPDVAKSLLVLLAATLVSILFDTLAEQKCR